MTSDDVNRYLRNEGGEGAASGPDKVTPEAAGADTSGAAADRELGRAIMRNISYHFAGNGRAVFLTVTALVAGGHLLFEDVPGVGKTTLAKALTGSVSGTFKRISLTPDVLPSDLTGFSVYNRKTEEFEFKKGALDCNFLLADEINRTSPKTQSSLLEAMQEERVSVDGVTYELPKPFMVIATQNPVELMGTYPLPEAQLDRFLMKLSLGYPDRTNELAVITAGAADKLTAKVQPVATCDDIVRMKNESAKVFISDQLADYVLRLVEATRRDGSISLGLSPRAGISLARAAKAMAFLYGRQYVLPDDVKALFVPVCAHRLMLSREAKLSGATPENKLAQLLKTVPVE